MGSRGEASDWPRHVSALSHVVSRRPAGGQHQADSDLCTVLVADQPQRCTDPSGCGGGDHRRLDVAWRCLGTPLLCIRSYLTERGFWAPAWWGLIPQAAAGFATLPGTKSVALGRFRWAHAREHMSTRTGVPAARNHSIRGVPPLPRWRSAGEARGPIVGWCQSTKLRCVATWSRLISVNLQDRYSATALTQGVSVRTASVRSPRRRARATRSSTTRRPSPWRRGPRSTARRRMRPCPWSPGTWVPVARMQPSAST